MARTSLVTKITAAYLAIGTVTLIVWRITGNARWASVFFPLPGGLVIMYMAIVGLWLGIQVTAYFGPGEALRKAWTLIVLSNILMFASAALVQLLRADFPLYPFLLAPGGGERALSVARLNGLTVGGPIRFTLIATGLFFVLKAYRQSGLLARLRAFDWLLLAVMALYVGRNLMAIATMVKGQPASPRFWQMVGWPVEPLLWVLVAEALLLFRSAQQMEAGSIGRCWKALALGIFLTAASDIGIWAANYGYLEGHWRALIFYAWVPAGAAFARAPALQLEAIRAATSRNASGAQPADS